MSHDFIYTCPIYVIYIRSICVIYMSHVSAGRQPVQRSLLRVVFTTKMSTSVHKNRSRQVNGNPMKCLANQMFSYMLHTIMGMLGLHKYIGRARVDVS